MWSYYGAKTNIIHLYPPPKYTKIIEPFAGTARYALKYWDRDILLVDKYDVIIKIWKWLQVCSKGDILRLPRKLESGMSLDKFKFDCEEAKMLMGFLISKGVQSPRNKITDWVAKDRPNFTNYLIQKIAFNLHKIKHWTMIHGSYLDIRNEKCTWFIDPPYQNGGQHYIHGSKSINYRDLAKWCIEREGQVMVCESIKSKWMNFKPFSPNRSGRGKNNIEGIWTNYENNYVEQKQLFE